MIINRDDLKAVLTDKGIKPTYQRLLILSYLKDRSDHPTVDKIHRDLVKEVPTMSKTTVYNTLKSFVEKGIISTVHVTGTESRYDYNASGHHHFYCEKCGAILDLDIVCPNFIRREVGGHQIKELHGYFRGICSKCLKSERR
jgi:Fur family peroxide stress response transcriptional regulator